MVEGSVWLPGVDVEAQEGHILDRWWVLELVLGWSPGVVEVEVVREVWKRLRHLDPKLFLARVLEKRDPNFPSRGNLQKRHCRSQCRVWLLQGFQMWLEEHGIRSLCWGMVTDRARM